MHTVLAYLVSCKDRDTLPRIVQDRLRRLRYGRTVVRLYRRGDARFSLTGEPLSRMILRRSRRDRVVVRFALKLKPVAKLLSQPGNWSARVISFFPRRPRGSLYYCGRLLSFAV